MSGKVKEGDLFAVCLNDPNRMSIGRVVKITDKKQCYGTIEWYFYKRKWSSHGFGLEVNITKLTGKLHEILYDI